MKLIKLLWPLFIVQFFTWIGLFAMWIYTTPVVTQYIFKAHSEKSPDYSRGIEWVGFCFAFYALLAGFLSFRVHKWSAKIGRYRYHSISLCVGAMGLMLMSWLNQPLPFLLSFAMIGIAWSSIGNIPYAILGELSNEENGERIYIVFNFSIIIPQVIAAFLLGFMTDHYFLGNSQKTLLFGGISMLMGGCIMLLIKPIKQPGLN